MKSEAYGHGVAIVAPAALRAGASWLAVWGANEGIPLRRLVGPEVPILCLGHTPPQDFADAVAADLRLTLYDPRPSRRWRATPGRRGARRACI